MRLYNTPKKKLEEFQPIDRHQVRIYTCGPTVYDYPHIGNWFTFIRYDLLVRLLTEMSYNPKWILNITDVGHLTSDADQGEDKLEKGARREGKTAQEIAEHYTDYFLEGMRRLNFLQPASLPRATENITEQIAMVGMLQELRYAYRIDDGIYFDTAKCPAYADFAGLRLEAQQTTGRVDDEAQKRNPADFALWKFSPGGVKRDMEWDSPWGIGFPGWHLECSAMILKFLGVTIDIHGGGIDHIPVHHTNEVAQSEAANGKPLSNYWFHTNHILIDGEKIAKSLGNGITLEDIEAKGFELMALRLLVISSHYRSQSVFNWETLEAAAHRLTSLRALADLRWQVNQKGGRPVKMRDLNNLYSILEDDLDTPAALTAMAEVSDRAHEVLVCPDGLEQFIEYIALLDRLFGLDLSTSPDITDIHKGLIKKRETARAEQDWAKADELRSALEKQGIVIRDTQLGPVWSRK